MSKRRIYNVNPTGDGDWEVKGRGADRAVKVFDNKTEAIERAKDLAQKGPLGQVVIRKSDGTIQTEHTYGEDPERSKG